MGTAERRQRERDRRREQIVLAAEEVFVEKGYWAAKMDEVAEAAELSKGSLYLHFSSKAELFTAILARYQQRCLDTLRDAPLGEGTGIEDLRRVAEIYLALITEKPDNARLFLAVLASMETFPFESPAFDGLRASVEQEIALFTEVVVRGQKDGSIREDVEPYHMIVHLWHGLLGLMVSGRGGDEKEGEESCCDPKEVARSFVEIFLRGAAAA